MRTHADDDFLLVVAETPGSTEVDSERVAEILASRETDSPALFEGEELELLRSWYASRVRAADSMLEAFLA